jgi:hypothetical protein
VYALFVTASDGKRLAAELKRRGTTCTLCPTPRHLSRSCGLALRFSPEDEAAVRAAASSVAVEARYVREK